MMRRSLFVFVLTLSFFFAGAQFRAAVSAGLNISSVRERVNDTFVTRTFLPRTDFGLDAGWQFSEHWGLTTGLYYAGKGFRVRFPLDYDTIIVRLHYLEVPLKITYKLSQVDDDLTVFAGPYFDYGFSAKQTFRGDDQLTFDPFKSGTYKRFDLGYMLGTQYGLNDRFSAKVQYTHGLLNLRRPDEKTRNFLFNFSLVYSLTKPKA